MATSGLLNAKLVGRRSELERAHTWGVLYAASLLATCWVGRKLASCCVNNQRNRLRDDYEHELRRGGAMSNRLLLPGYARK